MSIRNFIRIKRCSGQNGGVHVFKKKKEMFINSKFLFEWRQFVVKRRIKKNTLEMKIKKNIQESDICTTHNKNRDREAESRISP